LTVGRLGEETGVRQVACEPGISYLAIEVSKYTRTERALKPTEESGCESNRLSEKLRSEHVGVNAQPKVWRGKAHIGWAKCAPKNCASREGGPTRSSYTLVITTEGMAVAVA
jgi:hypothetical protein